MDLQKLTDMIQQDPIYHALFEAIATNKIGLIDVATVLDVYDVQSFSTSMTGKPDTEFQHVANDLRQLHHAAHIWFDDHGYTVGRRALKAGGFDYFVTSDIHNPKAYAFFADPFDAYQYAFKLIAPGRKVQV